MFSEKVDVLKRSYVIKTLLSNLALREWRIKDIGLQVHLAVVLSVI